MIVCLSLRKIWTVDYWWQWKLGEVIASTGIPPTDVFSYTDAGQPRSFAGATAGQHWLTMAFGHGAAVIAKCVIVVAIFGIAAARRRRRGAARSGSPY